MRRLHFETGMAMATLWAAKCFFDSPSKMSVYPDRYALVDILLHGEKKLAWAALTGALLIAVGLTCVKCQRCLDGSDYFRMGGLALSGGVWILLGTSFLFGSREAVTGPLLVLAGLACEGAMLLIARAPTWRIPNGK